MQYGNHEGYRKMPDDEMMAHETLLKSTTYEEAQEIFIALSLPAFKYSKLPI